MAELGQLQDITIDDAEEKVANQVGLSFREWVFRLESSKAIAEYCALEVKTVVVCDAEDRGDASKPRFTAIVQGREIKEGVRSECGRTALQRGTANDSNVIDIRC